MARSSRTESLKSLGGRKNLGIITPMVILIILMFVSFIVVGVFSKQDNQANRLASDLRLLSQTITTYALEASQGKNLNRKNNPFKRLAVERERFERKYIALLKGDSTGLPPAQKNADGTLKNKPLAALGKYWQTYDKNIKTILTYKSAVTNVINSVSQVNRLVPDMSADSHEVLSILVDNNARPSQIQKASIQLMLLERIEAKVKQILITPDISKEGKADAMAESAVDRFSRDAVIFDSVLRGMLNGDRSQGIRQVRDKDAITYLKKIRVNFEKIGNSVSQLKKQYTNLSLVHKAVNTISANNTYVFKTTLDLIAFYGEEAKFTSRVNLIGFICGGLAFLLLLLFFYRQSSDASSRTLAVEQRNREQQEAILRLLDEIQGLSEGDLTTEAVVTEDFTGAIADAFNTAIEELRKLVATINETSVQVSSAAQETQATAMHLADASDTQAQQITSVSQAINEMAESIEEVSTNSHESTKVAQNSVKIAHAGVATVRRNIQGMNAIREQIQETSKRIKRLGESSQEIGDIIELINDIADQTNILSLNAAIQAAMAGEAGRGFAVVADEVQRLAERSSNATKQIETLVKAIQADTNEAVISMEQSTAGVVKGAKMAEDAGEALAEIENVSNRLAELISNISESAAQQSRVSSSVSETMNVIQEITTQTSAGTNETAASVGNLADLANELRKSVSGFKLPVNMMK